MEHKTYFISSHCVERGKKRNVKTSGSSQQIVFSSNNRNENTFDDSKVK